jgi:isoamylase
VIVGDRAAGGDGLGNSLGGSPVLEIQEGAAQEWRRIVDTTRPSPDDFSESDCPLEQSQCTMAPRAIVVLLRPGGGKNERAI